MLPYFLNTQSWKVILTFEIFLFADIRGNKVSGLPERRAKILRGPGLVPRNVHISTNTKRNDKVSFPGKADTDLEKNRSQVTFSWTPKMKI